MLDKVLALAMSLLIGWMQTRDRGLSGEHWTFDGVEIGDVPDGYYAVVSVELKKVGGEPREAKPLCIVCLQEPAAEGRTTCVKCFDWSKVEPVENE
jgi:hypothetical protein